MNKTINDQVVVVTELKELFDTSTREEISIPKMHRLVQQYGAEKVANAINIIMTKSDWPLGAEACLVAALRDDWKLPTYMKNRNKPTNHNTNVNQPRRGSRDERYSAFYELFPDS